MTDEQAVMLAAIEQAHGRVKRIPDDDQLAERILCQCLTGTRLYRCSDCKCLFAIEPGGDTEMWSLVPLVD